MEPQFKARAAFRVTGIVARGRPEEIDFEAVWRDEFMPHHEALRGLSTDGAYYGLCIETGEAGVIDYLAGMAVSEAEELPEGLVVHEVRAAQDAVFECTVGTISETWGRIFGAWLAESAYEYDEPAECFERYPPDTSGEDSPVFIHVPVREARSI